jgi:DNA-binding NtrC family response regulator
VRETSSFLPVRIPAMARSESAGGGVAGAGGRELEFIVHSLVELRLQLDELKRRVEENGAAGGARNGAQISTQAGGRTALASSAEAIEPAAAPPANVLTVTPGMTMAAIERGAIEAALRETGGNRRRAAELLGIGERTLYRKLREYDIPDGYATIA